MQTTNFKIINASQAYSIQKAMYIFPPEDGHKTETCSGYWLKYSNQCCVRRKPWTLSSTRNRMQTTNFKIINASQAYSIQKAMYIFPLEDGHKTETCSGYCIKYSNQCCFRRKPWTWSSTRNRMQTTKFKWKMLHFSKLLCKCLPLREKLLTKCYARLATALSNISMWYQYTCIRMLSPDRDLLHVTTATKQLFFVLQKWECYIVVQLYNVYLNPWCGFFSETESRLAVKNFLFHGLCSVPSLYATHCHWLLDDSGPHLQPLSAQDSFRSIGS
jgi:hypothetical protein